MPMLNRLHKILGLRDNGRAARDYRRGIARVGGRWHPPSLAVSYAQAARAVYAAGMSSNGLTDMALPCFYLQRHALELALKDLLGALDKTEEDRVTIQKAQSMRVTGRPLSKTARKILTGSHSLGVLLRLLNENLKHTGRGTVPANWYSLVTSFESIEADSPERSRYP